MYGKGWKKIAGLIKTRTVVQIRTHAQKYFLKLAKARQNGDSGLSDGKSSSAGAKKKKKRRSTDRPLAVAPPLQPFVQLNGTDPLDVDDGLYNFLSPPLLPSSSTLSFEPQCHLKSGPSLTSMNGLNSSYDSNSSSSSSSNLQASLRVPLGGGIGIPLVSMPAPLFAEKPQWFQMGQNVGDLLKQAEGLDWMLDAGDVHVPEVDTTAQRARG